MGPSCPQETRLSLTKCTTMHLCNRQLEVSMGWLTPNCTLSPYVLTCQIWQFWVKHWGNKWRLKNIGAAGAPPLGFGAVTIPQKCHSPRCVTMPYLVVLGKTLQTCSGGCQENGPFTPPPFQSHLRWLELARISRVPVTSC